MPMTKNALLALAAAVALLPSVSLAQTAAPAAPAAAPAPAPAPEASPLSFNVGLVSDYRYRGISQTRFKPAIQGGVDYALPAGFYIGAWGSTIKWIKDSGGDAKVEVDFYGGWKGEVATGLTLDVGVLQYVYPSAKTATWDAAYGNPNTTELYGALSFGPATLKYSHAVTDLFGNRNSDGSGYLDLSASFDVGSGVTLAPHVGYQKVSGYTSTLSYTDYSLTASKDFSGFVVSLAVVGTDTKNVPANPNGNAYYSPSGKDLGKTGVVLGVKKTF